MQTNKFLSIEYGCSHEFHTNIMLHSHNNYEIVFFIDGDADYIVEGAIYPLRPDDIIIVRPREMHRAFMKSDTLYKRIIININEEFFTHFNCTEYKSVFNDRVIGTKNHIRADSTAEHGIDKFFTRLSKYTDNYKNFSSPIIFGLVLELLHLLNHINIKEYPYKNRIQEVIAYINKNFMSDITLSSIAEKFFISKAHLSREFRQRTGYTVSSYVNHKRIENTYALYREGKNLGNACIDSGFNDYTSFYRAFIKEYGCSPKKWLGGTMR